MKPVVKGAIQSLAAHPSVRVTGVEELANGKVDVRATFRVELPSRWAVDGQSGNGVLREEEVLIEFWDDFPESSPRFTLRENFPTSLPHIYPHKKGERVPPCITVGDKRDVLHGDGMYRLVDQMADWLQKAAMDELTDRRHGWELSRRDPNFNVLEADSSFFLREPPSYATWSLYSCHSFWTGDGKRSLAVELKAEPDAKRISELLKKPTESNKIKNARVAAAVIWPQAQGNGLAKIHEKYQADTVRTLVDLAARAVEWQCDDALRDFFKKNASCLSDSRLSGTTMLYLVFPVRRPLTVFGTQSDFEMMVYRVKVVLPSQISTRTAAEAIPVHFRTPVSEDLLRRTSALPSPGAGVRWTMAGCGSLGSKIAMHMARAGIQPALLIDEKNLAAHNVARHALMPDDAKNFAGKAERLSEIIAKFGGAAPATFDKDVRRLDFAAQAMQGYFSSDGCAVVNTTGSAAVRDYLNKANFGARVLEGAILNHGAAALLTVEGPGRNPSSLDLTYHCYELLRESGLLLESPFGEDSLLEVGVGCHSVTMPLSDARASLVAAGIGQRILSFDQRGLPETGIAAAATVGDDEMSISWVLDELGKTQIATVHDGAQWSVRVLDHAHKKIVADVANYPGVETGGIVVGSVSALTREIFVTDVLPAPPDSSRTATRFVLGVKGRAQMMDAYEAVGGHTLWCLGTWHSHLAVSGPSQMDRDTAELLRGRLRHAALLLIRHPEGYEALVEEGVPV